MKSNMYIPKKLVVGFIEDKSTYTEKLGYVVYYDHKGVLRKEESLNGWADKKIPRQEFENKPTEGFVLNKDIGGGGGRYSRKAKARAYDPRGFEIEITIENLLFILQEATSEKGKGLVGEFVYAWYGKDLVLLPVDCQEYRTSSVFSEKKGKSFPLRKLVPGREYLFNDMKKLVYLGEMDYNHFGYLTYGSEKKRIFACVSKDGKTKFYVEEKTLKIAEELSSCTHDSFLLFKHQYETSRFVSYPLRYVLLEDPDCKTPKNVQTDLSMYQFITNPEYNDKNGGSFLITTRKNRDGDTILSNEYRLTKKGAKHLYDIGYERFHTGYNPYSGALFQDEGTKKVKPDNSIVIDTSGFICCDQGLGIEFENGCIAPVRSYYFTTADLEGA